MSRRRWITAIVILLAGAALGVGITARFWKRPPTTNVILITLDTTRADRIGCYGHTDALTPTLDRLASKGILFDRAVSPAPLTLPTHASLLTGLYPAEHGLRTNGRSRLHESIPTLPEMLKSSGYETAAFLSSFVLDSKFGLGRGFDHYDDDLSGHVTDNSLQRQRDGRKTADAAIEWLGRPHAAPVFCWVHLYDPHEPYSDHVEEFGDRFHDRPYDAEIAYVDRQVARILQQVEDLEKRGFPNSIVIVVGDHGEGLEEHIERTHGYTLYESTQRVPWIVRLPEGLSRGSTSSSSEPRRVPDVVSLVDLTPTLLDLLGLEFPEPVTGRSVRKALEGTPLPEKPSLAATDDPFLQNGWSPLRSLTTARWKYVRTTRPELYDLQADPHEQRNLAESNAERSQEMAARLQEFEKRLNPRKSASVQLTAGERRALESLGYLRGADHAISSSDATALPDVKDLLPYDVAADKALRLADAGNLAEATERFRRIVGEAPSHVASKVFLGEMLERQGRTNEAMTWYQSALKQRPDFLNGLIHLGSAYAAMGRFPEAIVHFDDAVRIDPDSTTARYNLAKALVQRGELAEGIAQFEEAIRLDPLFPGLHAALGNALVASGQSEEAERQFRREIELNPESIEAANNLAALLANRDPQEAERLLRKVLQLRPTNTEALLNLGILLILADSPDEAIAPLERLVELRPQDRRAAAELERARKLAAGKPSR
ncbi:MAG: sulfatase-like hydrolase/transferase [Planctomycetaceae bacterium]|nr:sulfatase-like hydrolase/transferase [Planctomycetaceae bacterium]